MADNTRRGDPGRKRTPSASRAAASCAKRAGERSEPATASPGGGNPSVTTPEGAIQGGKNHRSIYIYIYIYICMGFFFLLGRRW